MILKSTNRTNRTVRKKDLKKEIPTSCWFWTGNPSWCQISCSPPTVKWKHSHHPCEVFSKSFACFSLKHALNEIWMAEYVVIGLYYGTELSWKRKKACHLWENQWDLGRFIYLAIVKVFGNKELLEISSRWGQNDKDVCSSKKICLVGCVCVSDSRFHLRNYLKAGTNTQTPYSRPEGTTRIVVLPV